MKVDNILVSSHDPNSTSLGPRVKLAGFGYSTELGESRNDTAGMSLGTPMTMAPELVSNGKPRTIAVDIWALGVLAYYLCTFGKYPFPGISKEVVKNKITSQEPEIDILRQIRVPDAAINFISKCLTKDVSARPTA